MEVIKIVTVGVCFPLKGYVHIGITMVAILQQTYKPFNYIHYIEGDKQQFTLLGSMYSLMVDYIFVDPRRVASPECTKQVYTPPLWN